MMQLIGSITSPYVRRIRLLLAQQPYQFVNLDIFADKDRAFLLQNNPALKVPALIDDDLTIYDSRVIYRYLAQKLKMPSISWQQENLLTLIDAVNDSLVTLLLSKRSELPVDDDVMFFNLQHQRLDKVFAALAQAAEQGEFDDWHYPSICLFALIDWVQFRDLYDLSDFESLLSFHQEAIKQAGVAQTDPRLS